jgi:hypothetical protein
VDCIFNLDWTHRGFWKMARPSKPTPGNLEGQRDGAMFLLTSQSVKYEKGEKNRYNWLV